MVGMTQEKYTKLQTLLSECEGSGPEFDNIFWKPLKSDEEIQEFKSLVEKVEESKGWPRHLNHKKGGILEDLAVFLFDRFTVVKKVEKNRRSDNETDVEISFSDKLLPSFIVNCIGPKIICECKNYKLKSIDVGMVTKLAEIIPDRGAKFGMFVSLNGIGGHGWRYGEGKRKKIMYAHRLPIISFTLNELKKLLNGSNFYSMIIEKYNLLVDEVDDESADVPDESSSEYSKRMSEIIDHFYKCNLIDVEQMELLKSKVIERYGVIDDD